MSSSWIYGWSNPIKLCPNQTQNLVLRSIKWGDLSLIFSSLPCHTPLHTLHIQCKHVHQNRSLCLPKWNSFGWPRQNYRTNHSACYNQRFTYTCIQSYKMCWLICSKRQFLLSSHRSHNHNDHVLSSLPNLHIVTWTDAQWSSMAFPPE